MSDQQEHHHDAAPPGAAPAGREAHRAFLNRYYGISRHFYDLTRKYYLFGRDVALRRLLREDWTRLLEVGVGTGRNLALLHDARPTAEYAGLDASDEMLTHVRQKHPWARVQHGFAEDADLTVPFGGERPDRVLFSYCLSMVSDPRAALANAQRWLAPGGSVVVVDFADLDGMPGLAASLLRRWLQTFHVKPLDHRILEEAGAKVRFGPLRYYVLGELGAKPR